MANLVIPPGFAQGLLRWQQTSQTKEYLCTIGLDLDGNPAADDVASELRGAWSSSFAASTLATDYAFLGATVYIGQDGGPPLVGESIIPVTGTSAGSRTTQNVAILVRKRTAFGGRRNRGRMYVPAGYLTEAGVGSDGTLDNTFRSTFQTNINAFLTTLPAVGVIAGACILHSTGLVGPTAVTSLTVEAKVATQRKRLRP